MRPQTLAAVVLVCLCSQRAACLAVPLVYSGYAQSFTKAANADYTMPANQDQMTSEVKITRGDIRGIYNVAQESFFTDNSSPVGTTWAFPNNNPEKTISAAGWQSEDLVFQDWQTANGGAGGGPPSTVGQNAVVHLTANDIYLDIRFTEWGVGSGSGGSFSYVRAPITPTADFNRDGAVDGDDFLTWQRNLGLSSALQTQGDADFNGVVNGADLAVWTAGYSGSAIPTSVPEPSGLVLAAVALAARRRR